MKNKLIFTTTANRTYTNAIIDRRFMIIKLSANEYKVITDIIGMTVLSELVLREELIVESMEKAKEECERRFYKFKADVIAEFSSNHLFEEELDFPYLDSEIIRENGKSKIMFKYVNEICTTEISSEVYQHLLYSGYMEKTKIISVFHQLQEEPKNWVHEETIGLKN